MRKIASNLLLKETQNKYFFCVNSQMGIELLKKLMVIMGSSF